MEEAHVQSARLPCELGPQLKIRAATMAAEAWEILKTTYEGQTRIHPMQTRRTYFSAT